MIWGFLYNILLNFLLDLKRLIIFGGELYNNNKSNIRFLLRVYGLITFKVVLYGRNIKIYIDINNNKYTPNQPLLILFLIIDFSYVWESNSIYSI